MEYRVFISPNDTPITIPIASSYLDVITLIKSDFSRYGSVPKRMWMVLVKAVLKPASFPLVWFRLSSYRGFAHYLSNKLYKRAMRSRNIDIPPQTRIGFGLYIGHGIDIVINEGTVIGNNVNISQFVNIGTNHSTPSYICDNVYIAPMVCVVEDVTIGECATIGAGAVVTHDIPALSTAVGVPAKVIHTNAPGRYIINPYPVKH